MPYPYNLIFANYPSASVFMNWLYQKNNGNESVFRNIAHSSESEDYKKVLNSVLDLGIGSYWDEVLTNWIDGVKKRQVNGAKINNWTNSSASLYPGALVYGDSKIQVNSNTYLGDKPEAITVNVSEVSSVSVRSINSKNSINLQTTQKPKYIDLVFDKDGKIKKY